MRVPSCRYGTGGSSDILARQIGARLQAIWGQGVAVDNRAGASSSIGTEAMVHAPPDGYTLLLQNSNAWWSTWPSTASSTTTRKRPDAHHAAGPHADRAGVAPGTNIKNLKELVAYSKANPTALNYGSCGVGTLQHFVMELVKQKSGVAATNVGYKGCAPALTDVVGGQVQLAILERQPRSAPSQDRQAQRHRRVDSRALPADAPGADL